MVGSPRMITHVFFDWGGVLVEYPPAKAYPRWAGILQVDEAHLRTAAATALPKFETGAGNETDFWRDTCAILGCSPPAEPIWLDVFRSTYVEHPAMLSLATELHGSGCTVGIISNTEPPIADFFRGKMETDPRYRVFSEPVFSCDVGVAKPLAGIFEVALSRFDVPPAQTVFLDDLEENVEAARRLEMNTVHVEDIDTAISEVRRFLATPGDHSIWSTK